MWINGHRSITNKSSSSKVLTPMKTVCIPNVCKRICVGWNVSLVQSHSTLTKIIFFLHGSFSAEARALKSNLILRKIMVILIHDLVMHFTWLKWILVREWNLFSHITNVDFSAFFSSSCLSPFKSYVVVSKWLWVQFSNVDVSTLLPVSVGLKSADSELWSNEHYFDPFFFRPL